MQPFFFLAIVLWSCNFHRPWNQRIQNVFLLICFFFIKLQQKSRTLVHLLHCLLQFYTIPVCCINQPISWVLKWRMHLHKVKWEMKVQKLKSWIPHGHSSHNNICSYQSHLHPLSCQKARIRYRLNTNSVETWSLVILRPFHMTLQWIAHNSVKLKYCSIHCQIWLGFSLSFQNASNNYQVCMMLRERRQHKNQSKMEEAVPLLNFKGISWHSEKHILYLFSLKAISRTLFLL